MDTGDRTERKLRIPSSEILLFSTQLLIIIIVVASSIYNLTKHNGDTNLWTALLSSCIGYILPNPTLKLSKSEPNN